MKYFICSLFLMLTLVWSDHAFADNEQSEKQYVVVEMSEAAPASAERRILTEIGVGAGFGLATEVTFGALVLYPVLVFSDSGKAFDYAVPVLYLALAAGIGGGVHLGGRLSDNVGQSWAPYVGALIGALIPLGMELSSHLYKDVWYTALAMRISAYSVAPLLILFGSVLAAELSHKSEKSKQLGAFAVVPYIDTGLDNQGKTFNTFGLSVVF